MPQSILAMLAFVVMATFSLSFLRSRSSIEKEIVRNEISLQASSIAVDHLERIGRAHFDQATVSGKPLSSSLSLTLPKNFKKDAQGDDVDDFDADTTMSFRMTEDLEVWYTVNTDVEYVLFDPDGNEISALVPTKFKRARVTVFPKDTLDINTPGGIAIEDTIRMSATYPCGSLCKW